MALIERLHAHRAGRTDRGDRGAAGTAGGEGEGGGVMNRFHPTTIISGDFAPRPAAFIFLAAPLHALSVSVRY